MDPELGGYTIRISFSHMSSSASPLPGLYSVNRGTTGISFTGSISLINPRNFHELRSAASPFRSVLER